MAIAEPAAASSTALPAPAGSLLAAGVPVRLAGALVVALGLWLAVAWALDWF